jgi:serine/threonine protein kinase
MKLLNIFSELQKYLRIGDTFAFFMDLSKYYFLGHIIQSLHDIEKKVHEEIHRQSEIVGDFSKFEDRYGREDIPFFLEIEKLYSKYELGLKNLLQQFNIVSSPSRDQIKKWFFVHLVGDRVTEVEKDFDAQFIVELNRFLDGIISESYKTIQAYRESVKKSIHSAACTQNKAAMEGIVTNLLELLAHLKEKRVAMRDLKPDNLLVAGDRDGYPAFLAYPEEYKIGLIDVETAVVFANSGGGAIEQPPLGGTPQYATPSHLFSNEVLAHSYESLSMVLHLQDWHGVIGIIYKTITGLPLFEKTAKIIPTIIKTMGEYKGKEKEHFHSVNEMFWNSAVTEFREKLAAREETLKSLSITVLDQTRKMFKGFVLDEKRTIDDQIQQCVNSRNVPMSAKDRQVLLTCSYEKTNQLRTRWENTTEAQTKSGIDKAQILSLLEELAKGKLKLERQEKMLKLLEHSGVKISVYELLEFMFELVLNRLYGEEWEWLVVGDLSDAAYQNGDPSSQSTIAITSEM